MNKNILFIAFIVLLIGNVCKAQDLHTDLKKYMRVRTFTHKDFVFDYPKSWRVFETTNYEKDIVVRVAHKSEISKRYMAIESYGENGAVNMAFFYSLDINIDSIPVQNRKYIKKKYIRKIAQNQFNISIEEMEFKTLEDFVENRKQKIARTVYAEGDFIKESDWHYIHAFHLFNVEGNENSPSGDTYYLMHYYKYKGLLYSLVSVVKTDAILQYKEDFHLIFSTFKFTKY